MKITEFLTHDHKHCDQIFAEAESLIAKNNWDAGAESFSSFAINLKAHLKMEENILFPAAEEQAGGSLGPVQVMKIEHSQMLELLSEMDQAVSQQNQNKFLGASDTLLVLMQQHNLKEEQILYPMTDQILTEQADIILDKMKNEQKSSSDN